MATQHDLQSLLEAWDPARFLDVLTRHPAAVCGVAVGMPHAEWATHFPDRHRLDEADGWLALGSEEYPDHDGAGFEFSFEIAGDDDDRAARDDIVQVSLKLRFRNDGGATTIAQSFRAQFLARVSEHFHTRLRRGSLALPGGPMDVSAVTEWERVFASIDVGWSMADTVGTTLLMTS